MEAGSVSRKDGRPRSSAEETGPKAVLPAVDSVACQLSRALRERLVRFPHLAG